MPRFEILPGLPTYGPLAEAFTATGQGRHSEGFVVRFESTDGQSWIGNFQPGLSGFCSVAEYPLNKKQFIVISGGQGYIVDPDDRNMRQYFGASIESMFPVPELEIVIFGNGLWFEAIGSSGHIWNTSRISWDGMKELRLEGYTLSGLAWSPPDDDWLSFTVDLVSGSHTGGSYNGPPYAPSADQG